MNRNHTKALSVAIAIAAAAAAPAFAQTTTSPTQQAMPQPTTAATPTDQTTFAQVDANHDGAVSQGEVTSNARLSAAFTTLDADGNGSLDSAEYAKFPAMPPSAPMDDGTMNDAGDMNGTTNDANDGSSDGTNDDTKKNEGTPVPATH